MIIFLDKTRLKQLSDSVLLVGIVLLVYNLASLANSDADFFDPTSFFNTLVAYVNSFIVVYLYWSLFSVLLTYIEKVDVIVIFIVYCILDTCYTCTCSKYIISAATKPTIPEFSCLYSCRPRNHANVCNVFEKA